MDRLCEAGASLPQGGGLGSTMAPGAVPQGNEVLEPRTTLDSPMGAPKYLCSQSRLARCQPKPADPF